MDVKDSCAISLRCTSKDGALETLVATERLLQRIPASSSVLRDLIEKWSDAVGIDACLAEVIEAIDPDLDPGGHLARERLEAMRVTTRARADRQRRTRETRRLRRVG
ncbi:MAG TPA: hypothetical protein VF765_21070 [Polyangiaceae bacterium]